MTKKQDAADARAADEAAKNISDTARGETTKTGGDEKVEWARMAQRPSKGRIVMVEFLDGRTFNGDPIMPAIVVNTFGDGSYVNVRVMVDAQVPPLWMTSVPARESEHAKGASAVWYWPERV